MTGARFFTMATVLLGTAFGLVEADADALAPQMASIVFWMAQIGLGLALAVFAQRLIARAAARARPIAQLLLSALIGSLLFAPVALALEWVFAPLGLGEADTAAVPLAQAWAEEWADLLPIYLASWLALNLGYRAYAQGPTRRMAGADLYGAADSTRAATAPASAPLGDGGFLEKVPAALGTALWHLETDLNYLRVVTRQGEALVLYSLARAEAELGDRGLRIHRRHWVAADAVMAVRRSANGWRVSLPNGQELPVSRRRQGAVRAMFGPDFRRPPPG